MFESGRLAGLGLDITAAPCAQHSAWRQPYPAAAQRRNRRAFPCTTAGSSETAAKGDFEYLVRLLKPRPVDARVGRRDIDVSAPGCNLAGIDKPGLHGVLRLGGALQAPFDR